MTKHSIASAVSTVANLKRSPVVSEINTALEWFLPLHSSKYRPGTDCTSSPTDSERTDERHSSISLPSSDPASGKKSPAVRDDRDVGLWHKADVQTGASRVCFRAKSGHPETTRRCPLMTQSGHSASHALA